MIQTPNRHELDDDKKDDDSDDEDDEDDEDDDPDAITYDTPRQRRRSPNLSHSAAMSNGKVYSKSDFNHDHRQVIRRVQVQLILHIVCCEYC